MKKFLSHCSSLGIASAIALAFQAGVARADFSPIPLTPGSYTFNVVVNSNYYPTVNEYTCWVGSGFNHTDTTYYEQGLYSSPGQYAGNSGVPQHNAIFSSINDSNAVFQMPASYLTNDDLIITVGGFGSNASGTLTLDTPTTAISLDLLTAGGNGGANVTYVVNHSDGSKDTGTLAIPDWFAQEAANAWGCNGRINTAGFANFSADTENINPPYLTIVPVKTSASSPVTSITLNWSAGTGVDNFFAISTSTDGVVYKPVGISGFNETTIVANNEPFPVTATMDNGTNIDVDAGFTFFEQGYDTNSTGSGLPPSGSILTSINGDGNTYQMGIYSNNDATLIDANHLSASITPVTPGVFSTLAFLTAGDGIGNGAVMSNTCVVQHQDGVNETNFVFGYDWANFANPGVLAYDAGESVHVAGRYLLVTNAELFESFVNVADTTPITNILVGYGLAPSTSSRTAIMAVSGTTTAFGPLIQQGPSPGSQEWYAKQTATISVNVVGTAPITNIWLVESNNLYVPLNNGIDVHGSIVTGADTTTLTISELTLADATNYEYEAISANSSDTSSNVVVVINTGTPEGAKISAQYPAASFTVLTNHADVTLFSATVDSNSAPPIDYQWYSISPAGVTNLIAGASGTVAPGSPATYANVDDSDNTLFVVVSNFVGMATSAPVSVSIVGSVGVPTAYEASVLALNPVGYWPLNEPSGIIAFDRAGTNDGSYIGGVILNQPGIPAAAALVSNVSVAFNGSNSYVTIPAGQTTLNITGPLSMMQWVLTPIAGETEFTTSFGHSDESYRISVQNGPTTPHFADSGPDVTSPNAINDGNWHFLVGVYDGVNQYLYVDGVEQGGFSSSEPQGNSIPLEIGGAPDYTTRYFTGNIAQCAVFTNALTPAQVKALYYDAETAPSDLTILPATPTLNVGRNVTLGAETASGNPVTSYQWFTVDTGNLTNIVTGATNSTFTLTNASLSQNGYLIGVTASNLYGSIVASVPLAVSDAAAALMNDLSPTNAEALTGLMATYTVTTSGSLPITYQWSVDGKVVSGETDSSYTFPVESGLHTLQVSCTNALSGGTPAVSDVASLTGVATAPTITFNGGLDWATNGGGGTVPFFGTNIYTTSNVFELTDDAAGEASDGFYSIAQYVGSWTASFVYQVHTFSIPSGDGATFMLQANTLATNAVGADDGGLGYSGITQSLALELDMFTAVGITAETNGITFANGGGSAYGPTGKISIDSGNPIQFNLSWTNGILAVDMQDLSTGNKYSTNYMLGSIVDILGSDFAYVGFSGSDGDANSVQWFYDFQFNPGASGGVTPPPPTGVPLTISGATASSFQISWPTSATGLTLQTAPTLTGPWTTGPTPTVVGANNVVTITIPGTGSGAFYRLAPQ